MQKNPLSSPCTSLHKHEQKDRTKILTEFPDHVSIDYMTHKNSWKVLRGTFLSTMMQSLVPPIPVSEVVSGIVKEHRWSFARHMTGSVMANVTLTIWGYVRINVEEGCTWKQ